MPDDALQELIHLFSKLPGIGPKSASRMVLFLLKNKEKLMYPLSRSLAASGESIKKCTTCGNLGVNLPCKICSNPKRDQSVVCVVEDISDLWALEKTGSFKGLYHVLGGALSALDNIGPDDLKIGQLVQRAKSEKIKEVILANSATVDGQTTAHYIADQLSSTDIILSRLAQGLPMGGELDFLDDGTITQALRARSKLQN